MPLWITWMRRQDDTLGTHLDTFTRVYRRRDLHREDGDVIVRPLPSLPLREIGQKRVDSLQERLGPCSLDRPPEAGIAELLAARVHRVREAVGVEIQPIP